MSEEVIITKKQNITAVADAIRTKTGSTATMSLSEMADNVMSISGDSISTDAVLYTAQSLTTEQQEQARVNIGAQETLTFDTTPKTGSTNPVTSSGLYKKFSTVEEDIEQAMATASFSFVNCLKWDGVIGDKKYIMRQDSDSSELGVVLVRISDEVPTIPDEINDVYINMTYLDNGFKSVRMMVEIEKSDDGLISIGMAIIVPTDNFDIEGITLSKGIWVIGQTAINIGYDFSVFWVSALYIPGYSFTSSSTSDVSKYFDTINTDTITWDGESGECIIIEKISNSSNVSLYYIANCSITYKDILEYYAIEEKKPMTIITSTGETLDYSEIQEMVSEALYMVKFSDLFNIYIALQDNVQYANVVLPTAGLYSIEIENDGAKYYPASITIPGCIIYPLTDSTENKTTLKPECLPDCVVQNGDKEMIIASSTEGSTKKFRITVDDTGTITATEVAS